MKFVVNVGNLDRLFRVIFGILFLAAAYSYLPVPTSYVVMLVGALLVCEGLVGYCIVYQMIGISTVGHPVCDYPKEETKTPVKKKARKKRKKK